MVNTFSRSDYTIGWICAIPIEVKAVLAILDDQHAAPSILEGDKNEYTFGRIGSHNVVVAVLPHYGTNAASSAATAMSMSFRRLRFGLMVGVAGGAPTKANDVRLGDIVVSYPTGMSTGVIQHDAGKALEKGEFLQLGVLTGPPPTLLAAIAVIRALDETELCERILEKSRGDVGVCQRFPYPGQDADKLFDPGYYYVDAGAKDHGGEREIKGCENCDVSALVPRSKRAYDHPYVHYGLISSGNQVIRDGMKRQELSTKSGVLCFEMEAAGVVDTLPSLIIRGICDYADGHKSKDWQPYAALVAAIFAKELLSQIPPGK